MRTILISLLLLVDDVDATRKKNTECASSAALFKEIKSSSSHVVLNLKYNSKISL